MNVETRQRIERQIARQIVRDAIAGGSTVSVHDGEEIVLRRSTSARAILAAMFSTDEDRLLIHREDVPTAVVYLVYGNDGYDVICDYSVSLEALLVGANQLADRLEQRYG